ncbi:INT8-like protein, partial [Mya arenaria]
GRSKGSNGPWPGNDACSFLFLQEAESNAGGSDTPASSHPGALTPPLTPPISSHSTLGDPVEQNDPSRQKPVQQVHSLLTELLKVTMEMSPDAAKFTDLHFDLREKAGVSVDNLQRCVQCGRTLRMPVLTSIPVPTELNDSPEFTWDIATEILPDEYICQLSYDLGTYFFYQESYHQALEMFRECKDLSKHGLVDLLIEDNVKQELSTAYRANLEDELAAKESLTFTFIQVSICNVMRGVMEGKAHVAEAAPSHSHFVPMVLQSDIRNHFTGYECDQLRKLEQGTKDNMSFSTTLDDLTTVASSYPSTRDSSVTMANVEHQLMFMYDADVTRHLVSELVVNQQKTPQYVMQLNEKWRVPFEMLEIIRKTQPSVDLAYTYILIGKACHCMDVKIFERARNLLSVAEQVAVEYSYTLAKHIRWHLLLVDLQQYFLTEHLAENTNLQDLVKKVKTCITAVRLAQDIQPSPDILEHCAAFLLNVRDWGYLMNLDNTNSGHIEDDITVEIYSDYLAIWPSALPNTSGVHVGAVEEHVSALMQHALQKIPSNASWLRTQADLLYANNQYSAAMKFYMEAGIVSSEFFANAVPKSIYDDTVYRKMMKCCNYLQCHTQVAVLCQFLDDVDYSAAFKALQEKHTYDAMDSYYVCIWDISILEYLMRALTQLDLNSNNPEDIIQRAVQIRKRKFLRALAKQYV